MMRTALEVDKDLLFLHVATSINWFRWKEGGTEHTGQVSHLPITLTKYASASKLFFKAWMIKSFLPAAWLRTSMSNIPCK